MVTGILPGKNQCPCMSFFFNLDYIDSLRAAPKTLSVPLTVKKKCEK